MLWFFSLFKILLPNIAQNKNSKAMAMCKKSDIFQNKTAFRQFINQNWKSIVTDSSTDTHTKKTTTSNYLPQKYKRNLLKNTKICTKMCFGNSTLPKPTNSPMKEKKHIMFMGCLVFQHFFVSSTLEKHELPHCV